MYDLTQKYRDYNSELFIRGVLDKDTYFRLENELDKSKKLLIISLN